MHSSRHLTTDFPGTCDTAYTYWSFSKQKLTIEKYNKLHNVTPVQETYISDIPDDTLPSVKDIDKDALAEENLTGKWMIFVSPDEIDEVWENVCEFIDNKTFWLVKASTNWARKKKQYDKHALFVYTPNYLDIDDIKRVRNILRDEFGFTNKLQYKTDYYTHLGIYENTLSSWNLKSEARYEF